MTTTQKISKQSKQIKGLIADLITYRDQVKKSIPKGKFSKVFYEFVMAIDSIFSRRKI